MIKEELFDSLEESREEFLDAIAGLSEEELLRPGCVGEWSVKDVLIHISRWEAELVKMLWQIKQGQHPSSQQFANMPIDEINQQWVAEYYQRPLEMALDDFDSVRRQTMRRVETFSNAELTDPRRFSWLQDRPLYEWIAEDSFRHEKEHAAQIRAWRVAQSL